MLWQQDKISAIIALPLEHFEGHRPSFAAEKHMRLIDTQSNVSDWDNWFSVQC
jgi:hypothetical protein